MEPKDCQEMPANNAHLRGVNKPQERRPKLWDTLRLIHKTDETNNVSGLVIQTGSFQVTFFSPNDLPYATNMEDEPTDVWLSRVHKR
jgi:hypothetical protein